MEKEREEILAKKAEELARITEELEKKRKEVLVYKDEELARLTEELERFRQETAPLAGPSNNEDSMTDIAS